MGASQVFPHIYVYIPNPFIKMDLHMDKERDKGDLCHFIKRNLIHVTKQEILKKFLPCKSHLEFARNLQNIAPCIHVTRGNILLISRNYNFLAPFLYLTMNFTLFIFKFGGMI